MQSFCRIKALSGRILMCLSSLNKLSITSKRILMDSNTQVSSTQMHKAFFGQGMILYVVGWMFERLLNIWALVCWMFKCDMELGLKQFVECPIHQCHLCLVGIIQSWWNERLCMDAMDYDDMGYFCLFLFFGVVLFDIIYVVLLIYATLKVKAWMSIL